MPALDQNQNGTPSIGGSALNKQTLINLLIDSPLREPIKINLIDIVNNTADADLSKVYPTITKELEIFQKATDRRLKLADETIKKLSGEESSTPAVAPAPAATEPTENPDASPSPAQEPPALPPVPTAEPALQVPPLDLPPLPTMNKDEDIAPSLTPTEPATPAPATEQPAGEADEAALKEIQQELDALKNDVAMDLPAKAEEEVSAQADSAPAEPTPPQT